VDLQRQQAGPQAAQARHARPALAAGRRAARGRRRRRRGRARGGPGAPLQLDPLVGYKVQRFWPQHGGWFEGIISDFNLSTNEHWRGPLLGQGLVCG